MQVIDSSIWIEIYSGSEIGRKYLPLLSSPEDIIVPTIVQLEIFKWLARVRTSEEANRAITFTNDGHVIGLTTAIAVYAAHLGAKHKLHTTDAIIYATAQLHDALLVTCDAHFKGLEGVEYFEK
jgi:predicted nucleic acid-binding protein